MTTTITTALDLRAFAATLPEAGWALILLPCGCPAVMQRGEDAPRGPAVEVRPVDLSAPDDECEHDARGWLSSAGVEYPVTVLYRPDAPAQPTPAPVDGDGVEHDGDRWWESLVEVACERGHVVFVDDGDGGVYACPLCALAAARAGEAEAGLCGHVMFSGSPCTKPAGHDEHHWHDPWAERYPASAAGEGAEVGREALANLLDGFFVRERVLRQRSLAERMADAVIAFLAARGDAAVPSVTAEQVREVVDRYAQDLDDPPGIEPEDAWRLVRDLRALIGDEVAP